MKVTRLKLNNFTRHASTEVQLPERAVVLVTGANGRGKSSFLEAVAYAGWKRGLRHARWAPWKADVAGAVELDTDRVQIRRRATKSGSVSTTWNTPGTEPVKYETATKSQEALEHLIGDFDVWVRACTFSKAHAQKAARFGAATDGERKALLETILGLDYFDTALKRCREDLKKLRTDKANADHDLALETVRRDNATQRKNEVSADLARIVIPNAAPKPEPTPLPALPDAAALPARVVTPEETALQAAIRTLTNQLQAEETRVATLSEQLADQRVGAARLDSDAETARRQHARLANGTCPECSQPVPSALVESLAAKVAAAQATLAAEQVVAATRREMLVDQRDEAKLNRDDFAAQKAAQEQKLAALQASLASAHAATHREALALRTSIEAQRAALQAANSAALAAWEQADAARVAAVKQHADLTARLASAVDAVAAAAAKVEACAAKQDELAHRIALKEAAEYALSPKGFRAHLLGKTLAGFTACTNAWLAMLGYANLTIELRPYSEKADGDQADAIDLKVHGVGHQYGYAGCSDGEQRRLDIAILLALMEISTGALGAQDSTLWLDEVFDALDVEGVRAVCSLLDRLAEERTVVVIAHSQTLIEALRPQMVLQVEADPDAPENTRVRAVSRSDHGT